MTHTIPVVLSCHLFVTEKSEKIALNIVSRIPGAEIPAELVPESDGVKVVTPWFNYTVKPKRRKREPVDIRKYVLFDKFSLTANIGTFLPFIVKNIYFEKSIIMILSLIENTLGIDLGKKSAFAALTEAPARCIDIAFKARINFAGIIFAKVMKIFGR